MKRYKVEMQREGSVKYFFIRDMETLEIVLLPSKYLMHQVRANRSRILYGEMHLPLPTTGNICWKKNMKQKMSMEWITKRNMIFSQNI